MAKMTEKEMQDAVAAAAVKSQADKVRADDAEDRLSKETARADRAEGELASVREKLNKADKDKIPQSKLDEKDAQIRGLEIRLQAETKARLDAQDPNRLRKEVTARVKMESAAAVVLGDRAHLDAYSNRELMVAVVEKLHGVKIDDDKSDDFVEARFDAAIEGFRSGEAALSRVRDVLGGQQRQDNAPANAQSARDAMIDRNRNAWKPKTA